MPILLTQEKIEGITNSARNANSKFIFTDMLPTFTVMNTFWKFKDREQSNKSDHDTSQLTDSTEI